jgi:glycosyltransferase involved in cell wall biosynthesis
VGVEGSKIRVVYYGCDGSRFYPTGDAERARLREKLGWGLKQEVVAFVGALGDRRKGFDTVLSAWADLAREGAPPRLVVVGRGAELDRFKGRVVEAGLGECVEFLGFRKDVPDILRACDALVSPTRYEAFGLGVQEALLCGLPAIVTRSAGVAELYPPELHTLLIDDPDDVHGVANRLRGWRENREVYRACCRSIAGRLATRSWDVMGSEIARHLEIIETRAESTRNARNRGTGDGVGVRNDSPVAASLEES